MRWASYNPNPEKRKAGDCSVRALSKVLDQDWDKTFIQLCNWAYRLCDMPSANHVWGAMLKDRGFVREAIPTDCPDCYTVIDFCKDHSDGKFILALSGHVVAVVDGMYYDSWDSGYEIPIYYWHKKETKE